VNISPKGILGDAITELERTKMAIRIIGTIFFMASSFVRKLKGSLFPSDN